jgi:hypothetical protein
LGFRSRSAARRCRALQCRVRPQPRRCRVERLRPLRRPSERAAPRPRPRPRRHVDAPLKLRVLHVSQKQEAPAGARSSASRTWQSLSGSSYPERRRQQRLAAAQPPRSRHSASSSSRCSSHCGVPLRTTSGWRPSQVKTSLPSTHRSGILEWTSSPQTFRVPQSVLPVAEGRIIFEPRNHSNGRTRKEPRTVQARSNLEISWVCRFYRGDRRGQLTRFGSN